MAVTRRSTTNYLNTTTGVRHKTKRNAAKAAGISMQMLNTVLRSPYGRIRAVAALPPLHRRVRRRPVRSFWR